MLIPARRYANALSAWLFTQTAYLRAGLQADLKITEFLLGAGA